jgi:hypothetical protein
VLIKKSFINKALCHKVFFYFFALFLSTNAQFSQAEGDIFPKLYPADKTKPIEIITEKIWTAADEEPKDGQNVISNEKYHNPDHLPLGQGTRYIATFKPEAGKGPVKLILDYAGTAETLTKHPDDGVVMVNVALICPESPELTNCLRSQGQHSWTQDMTYPFYRARPSQDSKKPFLYTSHSYLEYDFAPDKPVTIAISFNAPAYATTHQLKTTLIYGDYALTPQPTFKLDGGYIHIGNIGRSLIGMAFFALLFAWLFKYFDKSADGIDSPKIFAVLLSIWAALLGLFGLSNDMLSYYAIIGIIFAYSGFLMFLGKRAALWLFAFGLIAAWSLSILELGFVFKPLFTQAGFITLLGLYVFSARVAGRLGFEKQGFDD